MVFRRPDAKTSEGILKIAGVSDDGKCAGQSKRQETLNLFGRHETPPVREGTYAQDSGEMFAHDRRRPELRMRHNLFNR
jgi:hypothetical protein